MSDSLDFTLSWKPNKGKATITAEQDGEVIHVDTIDPTTAASRIRYAKALAAKECDKEQAESDLLQIAPSSIRKRLIQRRSQHHHSHHPWIC